MTDSPPSLSTNLGSSVALTDAARQEANKAKCNSIYRTLLRHNKGGTIPATTYIREFFETARCDHVSNFAPQREEYTKMIGNADVGSLARIMAYDGTAKDEEIAIQAVVHYAHWHKQHLVASLSWRSYLDYQIFQLGESTLATIGFVGGVYVGMRAAQASFRFIKKSYQAQAAAAAAAKGPV